MFTSMLRLLCIISLCLSSLVKEAFTEEIYDVAIVGGGVSGTYCAWRLTENESKTSSICLLESSNRIGGRLFSVALPQSPNMVAEIGGMRYTDAQLNVFGLIDHLGLTRAYFDKDSTENLIYLRRKRFQASELKQDPSKLPYNFREDEKGKSSRELMMMALHKIFPDIKAMTQQQVQEYLKTAKYKGKSLWEVGYWNLLMSELSIEAYNFIRDGGGYYSSVSNWNAYDAIVSFSKYNTAVTFYKVKEGFDALPKKMADRFVEKGGKLQFNSEVTSLKKIQKDGQELVQLTLHSPSSTSEKSVVLAKKVILALPKRAIELLDSDSFIFEQKQFVQDLKRVTPEYASKIFLWYDEAWWSKLGFSIGPSRTDLPLRQCYYFGMEPNNKGQMPKGLLMASYNDGIAVDFWEGYLPQSSFDRNSTNFTSLDEYLKTHALPSMMIQELSQELSELHGVQVPKPSFTVFQNWSDDPYGGAWHYWNPNNQSWIVIPRIRHPIPNVNLYICGEAYSTNQGWVEGAVNTAEKLLQDHFGLPRASWIKPTYDLGP